MKNIIYERQNAIMIYNITKPKEATFVKYIKVDSANISP